MDPLLKKLNFKNQENILVLNAPEEFSQSLRQFRDFANVDEAVDTETYGFALAFVKSENDIEASLQFVRSNLIADALLWYAYPKKSSKKYKSELHRDQGWKQLGELGFEPVRQVAIDGEWTAVRFRQVQNIKTFTRNKEMTLSEEGQKRAKKIRAYSNNGSV